MKAICYHQYGSPDVLQLRDVPQPSPKDMTTRVQMTLFLMPWPKTLSPTVKPRSKLGKKKAILALTGLRATRDKAKDLAFLQGAIEAGQLKPVIGQCYPFEQIAVAHRYVETGHKIGSAVIAIASFPSESPPS